jgi:hypothetical protein
MTITEERFEALRADWKECRDGLNESRKVLAALIACLEALVGRLHPSADGKGTHRLIIGDSERLTIQTALSEARTHLMGRS